MGTLVFLGAAVRVDLHTHHNEVLRSHRLACLVSAISGEITCDDCLQFAGEMQTHFMSAESVAQQTELLIEALCPQSSDPGMCEEVFNKYWSPITAAMFPVFLDPTGVCGDLGACKVKSLLSEPTCDECTGAFAMVAEILGTEEKIAEVIEFLKGDGFCAGNADADMCVQFVDAAMPYAMPVLASLLVDRAAEHCCEMSSSGICC